ncbi:HU family DNA-binding protein [Lactobacillus sp. ESL0681]|uniref:HU family DNA-binding protein n=1 Tax=Lactobacillus sp. ESL0681 TaxID=2983211 RepID=UPI0023F8CA50|nr:HU family DNA-binding protein [Lactobacillus sp. ESL0681]WEV41310.1 HU family DNA-binding protein [Lactobacillus sp. ESL0681]
MVNKAELVAEVAQKADMTKKDTAKAIEATFATIQEDLAKGDKVQLIGFGSFEVRDRAARKGRNPQTGKVVKIPASKSPAFKAGKALKAAVQNKKKGKK